MIYCLMHHSQPYGRAMEGALIYRRTVASYLTFVLFPLVSVSKPGKYRSVCDLVFSRSFFLPGFLPFSFLPCGSERGVSDIFPLRNGRVFHGSTLAAEGYETRSLSETHPLQYPYELKHLGKRHENHFCMNTRF